MQPKSKRQRIAVGDRYCSGVVVHANGAKRTTEMGTGTANKRRPVCGVRVSSGNGMVAGGREGDEVKRAVSGQNVECRCGRAVEKLESLNSLKIWVKQRPWLSRQLLKQINKPTAGCVSIRKRQKILTFE
jgi:hypothetical protein